MTRSILALAVVAACAGQTSDGGENPSTLWFGMSSNREMRLVAQEPRPY